MVVSALLLFAYIALLLTVNSAQFQEWAKTEIANRTGYDISVRDIRLDSRLRLTLVEFTASKAANLALQAERVIIVPSPAILYSRSIQRLQLEKPVLSFDIQEYLSEAKKTPMAVSIRHFIINDGTLILRTGKGGEVDFRSIAMSAENLNLGQGTGIELRAAVPWLGGTTFIEVQDTGAVTEALIRLEQSDSGKERRSRSTNRQAMQTHIKLVRTQDGLIRVSTQGKLDAARFGGWSLSGEVSGEVEFNPESKAASFTANAVAVEPPKNSFSLPVPLPKGQTTLKIRGKYQLADKNLSFEFIELISPLGQAKGHALLSFDAALAWKASRLHLRKVAVENLKPLLPSPMNSMVVGGVAEADLEIEGPWRTPAVAGSARVFGVKLQHDQFSLADLVLKTPIRWNDGDFRAGDVKLSGRKFLLKRNQQMEVSAEAVGITGTLEKKKHLAVSAAGTLQIQQGAFASADNSKIGEKLALEARIDSLRVGDGDGVALAGKVKLTQGEILWGKFYGDLKTQRPTLEIEGEYRRGGDLLRLRRANLELVTAGHISVRGDVSSISTTPVARLAIKSDAIHGAGVFEYFLRETLNRSYPILDQLTVGGRFTLSAEASGPLRAPTVEGTITLLGGQLRAKSDNWHLAGIEIALPFRLSYPTALSKAPVVKPAIGSLNIEFVKFGTEVIRGVKSTLSLENNNLRIHQPIRLPIYGGSLVINDLAWQDIIATPKAVSLSLEAIDLQLRKLTEELGWYRFGGSLSGSIPKIEWTGNSLRSQGRIDIAVFGGLLRMNQLEIETPFSKVPAIKLDARFQDISLEQASETFAFGRISGVLAGTINDLVVTANQPAAFTADIYSVEKSGIGQRISVESLNKITVLSSGQEAGALYGGIAGFFESFRYSKLGFKATLNNDRLTLRGVETRDGQEYLVVGSFFPPTVNVVSHTQEIAFSELLRRIERIQKSEKTRKSTQ